MATNDPPKMDAQKDKAKNAFKQASVPSAAPVQARSVALQNAIGAQKKDQDKASSLQNQLSAAKGAPNAAALRAASETAKTKANASTQEVKVNKSLYDGEARKFQAAQAQAAKQNANNGLKK